MRLVHLKSFGYLKVHGPRECKEFAAADGGCTVGQCWRPEDRRVWFSSCLFRIGVMCAIVVMTL